MMEVIKNLTFAGDFGHLVYDQYLPDCANANGVVIQIAHGMIEHRGRYVWLCQRLAQAGYRVFIHDHRGHGESIAGVIQRGEMGDNGFDKAVQDMRTLHIISASQFPHCKQVLLGHSMGSLLARRFLQLYQHDAACHIDGIILCGTPAPGYFLAAGNVLLKLLLTAGLRRVPKIADLFSYDRKFKRHSKTAGYWACSDQQVVNAYLQDEKSQFRFTLNSFYWLSLGLQQVFSRWSDKPVNPELPILFLSGEQDACGNFTNGIKKASGHLQSQGYRNVSLKIYANVRHEVFNEPNKAAIFADTIYWLQSQQL